MAFNVAEFRSALVGDGARPNLFNVSLTFPPSVNGGGAAGAKTQFLARAAQLPGSEVSSIPLYYFGRELKFAGNRRFSDWSVTVINDEDFIVRNAIERWMNLLNSHESNIRDAGSISPTSYTSEAQVTQYGKAGAGTQLKQYNFVGMFPIDLSAIDLNWQSTDEIEEYTITFAYQYWTSGTTT